MSVSGGKDGILIQEYNCIYIINPKAGTTSIKTFLMKDLLKCDANLDPHKFKFQKISKSEIAKLSKYYKFTFVRNPWDRVVSCYTDKIAKYSLEGNEPAIFKGFAWRYGWKPGMKFEEFIKAICEIPDALANPHFASQYSLCYYKMKPLYDFVGKLENIGEDFSKLGNILKFPNNNLPHKLRTSNKYKSGNVHYTEFYTKETMEMIRQRFGKDIELFDYSFGK